MKIPLLPASSRQGRRDYYETMPLYIFLLPRRGRMKERGIF
jgi:hypothetical protein